MDFGPNIDLYTRSMVKIFESDSTAWLATGSLSADVDPWAGEQSSATRISKPVLFMTFFMTFLSIREPAQARIQTGFYLSCRTDASPVKRRVLSPAPASAYARPVDPHPDYPFRFHCQRSGNCCSLPEGVVRVTPEDVERIASHLGLEVPAFRSRYLAASGDRLIDGLGGRCIFLEDGRHTSCQIYPVRPEKCRSWPHWPELKDDPEALHEACRMCPGIELKHSSQPSR